VYIGISNPRRSRQWLEVDLSEANRCCPTLRRPSNTYYYYDCTTTIWPGESGVSLSLMLCELAMSARRGLCGPWTPPTRRANQHRTTRRTRGDTAAWPGPPASPRPGRDRRWHRGLIGTGGDTAAWSGPLATSRPGRDRHGAVAGPGSSAWRTCSSLPSTWSGTRLSCHTIKLISY